MFRHGFLGHDASFMLDFVVTALIVLVPIQLYSLYLVKFRRNFLWHRNLQVALGLTLLVAVTAFEVDMQLIHGGWMNVVNKDPDVPRLTSEKIAHVQQVLRIHLLFAITTPLLWGITLFLALRNYRAPKFVGPHSR
ncbi:MAG TPA: DUF420 domain-containing protein, partial [Planctomicrobium sp.]|nr:DUF420 domain-containing protein [Planctomicrobium sp.]